MNLSTWLPACAALSSLWIATLWQGVVLAAVTALLQRAMPMLTPRLRYQVWSAAYAACILLPVVDWLGRDRGSIAGLLAAGSAAAFAPLLTVDRSWTMLCGGLWMAASLFAAVRLGAGLWSIRQLLRSAVPLPEGEATRYASLLQLRSRGQVTLLVSDRIELPVATGYLKPAIMLPRALLAGLSEEQIEQVLRHELEHLARRDDWVTLLFGCVRCIFPLHPVLAWFERQMVATREMACDDAVLRSAPPHAYAMNLTQIAVRTAESVVRRSPCVSPNLLGARSQLAHRIEHILSGRRESLRSARAPLFAVSAGLLILSALLVHGPTLIAFRTGAVTAVADAGLRLPASRLPASRLAVSVPVLVAVPVSMPADTHARVRQLVLRRPPRGAVATPRLHASRRSVTLSPERSSAAAQPSAVLVVWNDPGNGFFATLVFDLRPCPRSAHSVRRGCFSLEI